MTTQVRIAVTFESPERLRKWEEVLAALAATAIPIMPGDNVRRKIADAHGLLLTGGADIASSLYGELPHPESDRTDSARDELELVLLKAGTDRGIPLFGVCRGMQMLNVYCGGGLQQHLVDSHLHHQRYCRAGVSVIHQVSISPSTWLATVTASATAIVNSRHHQAISRLGQGLIPSARAGGVIEAVEHQIYPFAAGVQWHPEDRCGSCEKDRRVVAAFVSAARTYAATRTCPDIHLVQQIQM